MRAQVCSYPLPTGPSNKLQQKKPSVPSCLRIPEVRNTDATSKSLRSCANSTPRLEEFLGPSCQLFRIFLSPVQQTTNISPGCAFVLLLPLCKRAIQHKQMKKLPREANNHKLQKHTVLFSIHLWLKIRLEGSRLFTVLWPMAVWTQSPELQ